MTPVDQCPACGADTACGDAEGGEPLSICTALDDVCGWDSLSRGSRHPSQQSDDVLEVNTVNHMAELLKRDPDAWERALAVALDEAKLFDQAWALDQMRPFLPSTAAA